MSEVLGDEARQQREWQTRRSIAITRWMERQGAKIKAARPGPVYGLCLLLALARCGRTDWVHLSEEQIQECEMQALSSGRAKMFGTLPRTNEAWDEQIAQVRASWAQPVEKAA